MGRKSKREGLPALLIFAAWIIALALVLLLSGTATWAKSIELGGHSINASVKSRNLTAELDSDSTGFIIKAWGDECYFRVNGLVPDATRFYKRTDGNLEWEIIIPFKLPTNSYSFPIETKGLRFLFQDSMIIASKLELSCADSVYNSTAVYHENKRNNRRIINGVDTTYENYMAGKAFHIYRPIAFDDDGYWTWCNLDITDGQIRLTVPQHFLDDATYPVTIDPTIGYTTLGGTDLTPTDYRHYINWDNSHTPTTGGDMDYAYIGNKGITTHSAKVCSWTKGVNCVQTDAHYESGLITIPDNATAHWDSVAATGSFTTSVEYIVSIVCEFGGAGAVRLRLDIGGTDSKTYDDDDMTQDADLGGCDNDATDYEYSGYMSYTEAGGDGELPKRRRRLLQ